uniref:Uncharacterized protein n=1 Tax=Cannabis sativa TaxID=3483 RepID=A0A803PSE7_CANSA
MGWRKSFELKINSFKDRVEHGIKMKNKKEKKAVQSYDGCCITIFMQVKTSDDLDSDDADDRGDGSTDDNHYYDKVGADASAVGEVQGVVVPCSEDDNSRDVDNVKGKEIDVKGDDFFNGLSQLEIDDDQVIFASLEAVAKINTRRAIRKPIVRELSVELGARSEKEARIGQENVVEEVRTSQEAVIEAILKDGVCDLIMENENFDLGEGEEKIGRLLIIWKRTFARVIVVEETSQNVHYVKLASHTQAFCSTFVYGLNCLEERKELWKSLVNLRLAQMKHVLKVFNTSRIGNVESNYQKARDMFLVARLEAQNSRDEIYLNEESVVAADFVLHKKMLRSFLVQMSKVNWLNQGDGNTTYFFACIKKRREENRIASFIDYKGNIIKNYPEVVKHYIDHFKSYMGICSTFGCRLDSSVLDIGNRLNLSQQLKLIHPFTNKEIKEAMLSIPILKSPGPDRYNFELFKVLWSEIGVEMCSAIMEFFSSCKIRSQLNETIICLVPTVGIL